MADVIKKQKRNKEYPDRINSTPTIRISNLHDTRDMRNTEKL